MQELNSETISDLSGLICTCNRNLEVIKKFF